MRTVVSRGCMTIVIRRVASMMGMLAPSHHAHHFDASSPEEDNGQYHKEDAEDDVQHRRVIERDSRVDDRGMALMRHPPRQMKEPLHDERGEHHRDIERHSHECRHLSAVILAVDIQDRQDDEVAENE
jgi:hypothetical protein